MKESFDNKNQEYISKWIESNPNFSNIKFENNSILFSNGSKIDLNNFSLCSLLENNNFTANLNLMDEPLLYKIIYANAEIYKFYNRDTNIDEYIKDIKITDQGNVLIIGPDVYNMFNAGQAQLSIPIYKPGSQQIVILDENYVGMFNGMVKVYLDENLGDSCIIAYIGKGINSGIKIEVI